MDLASTAQQLRVPTLILCGGRDRLTAPGLSQQLCGMIAGSRLQIVPGAGHMLPLEALEVLNQAMREFAASVAHAVVAAPDRAFCVAFSKHGGSSSGKLSHRGGDR